MTAPATDLGTVVVVLEEDLDLSTAARVRHRLEEAHGIRPDRLVVDLRGCRFVDAAGLAVLLEARRRTLARGAAFVLCDVPPLVHRLLALTATGGLFEIEARDRGLRRPAPAPGPRVPGVTGEWRSGQDREGSRAARAGAASRPSRNGARA